jgi:uncharacterized protein (UPF0248 family)
LHSLKILHFAAFLNHLSRKREIFFGESFISLLFSSFYDHVQNGEWANNATLKQRHKATHTQQHRRPMEQAAHERRRDKESGRLKKKERLRTSQEVYNRIMWDTTRYDPKSFVIGYLDRFDGMMELPLDEFVPIDKGGDIAYHRVYYFRQGDVVVWDRNNRIDNVFGSGNTAAAAAFAARTTTTTTTTTPSSSDEGSSASSASEEDEQETPAEEQQSVAATTTSAVPDQRPTQGSFPSASLASC